MSTVRFATFFFLCSAAGWAQAPYNVAATTATSQQVVLTWQGSASSFSVQRAVLGGSFAVIGTASANTYTDNSIDPYTTYQYEILNGTAASAPITIGPPPIGVTLAAPAPVVGNQPAGGYGDNIALTLDGNGDPAFVFLFDDPNTDGTGTTFLFRSWNRATYNWNAVVTIGTVGPVATTSHAPTALGYDPSTGMYAAASEVGSLNSVSTVNLWTSPDGMIWTLKNNFAAPPANIIGPSLALRSGNIYLALQENPSALDYYTGQLNQPVSTWTMMQAPAFNTYNSNYSVNPSLALDSAGVPGIAYMALDPNDENNGPVLFWRPDAGTVVQITDSQENGTGTAVKLIYYGLNPRVLMELPRDTSGANLYFAHSEDGGTTWQTPSKVPPDGNSSADYPFDIAADSKDNIGVGFGQNVNAGDDSHKCGNPKYSTSNDLTSFTTCSFAPLSVTQSFNVYPGGIQIAYAGNDGLLYMWLEYGGASDNASNTGVLLYRQPPAGAILNPGITSVSDNNVTRATIVGGSWISVFGTNLSTTTRTWAGPDFDNGDALPSELDGVSVTTAGMAGSVYYISPSQINVLAPSPITGTVPVQVTHAGYTSNVLMVDTSQNLPTLYVYTGGGTTYPAAVFANSGIIVGDPAIFGTAVAKAKPGDYIQLYVNGLQSAPAGMIINSVQVYQNPVTVTIGGVNAPVQFAGLVAAGEFQVNIQVPQLSSGLYPIVLSTLGQSTQSGVMFPIQ